MIKYFCRGYSLQKETLEDMYFSLAIDPIQKCQILTKWFEVEPFCGSMYGCAFETNRRGFTWRVGWNRQKPAARIPTSWLASRKALRGLLFVCRRSLFIINIPSVSGSGVFLGRIRICGTGLIRRWRNQTRPGSLGSDLCQVYPRDLEAERNMITFSLRSGPGG